MVRNPSHLFVCTAEVAEAMDLASGPTEPIVPPGGRKVRPLVSERAISYTYAPAFIAEIGRVVDPSSVGLELVRDDRVASLFRLAPSAASRLAELTPDRADETARFIEYAADQLMSPRTIASHFKRGGVSSALLIVRGYALKTVDPGEPRSVYYWVRKS